MPAPFWFLDVPEPAGRHVMPAPAVAAHWGSLGRLSSCTTAQFCDKGMDSGNQGVLRFQGRFREGRGVEVVG